MKETHLLNNGTSPYYYDGLWQLDSQAITSCQHCLPGGSRQFYHQYVVNTNTRMTNTFEFTNVTICTICLSYFTWPTHDTE